ncbi:hypothetical protein SETIT_8G033200v2 [Setaria italica]|uniref:Uncharacterized protein n=1 Tax=Setaria italica TaxID=4555 RepID=A0A368S3M6_SETIT|nr:hypothetical protein SETIT_8G033200v2 [Setaria italica]
MERPHPPPAHPKPIPSVSTKAAANPTASTAEQPVPARASPTPLAELCLQPPAHGSVKQDAPRQIRPGITFEDCLLRDFYSVAIPSFLTAASPASGILWMTSSSTPFPNSFQVSNLLNFHLAPPPFVFRPPRKTTPWPHQLTVPVPTTRVPVHPMSYTTRDASTTPPISAAPPPSPLVTLPPFTPAFDPLHLIPSSSSTDFEFTPTPPAAVSPAPPAPTVPSERAPSEDAGSPGRRSPPLVASPVRIPAVVHAPAPPLHGGMDDVDDFIPGDLPSYEEEDPDADLLWMPEGDMKFAHRVAYAFLNEDAPTANPAPFIRAAIYSAANAAVHYRMFPSSMDTMMLVFDSQMLRDAVVEESPIIHDGGRVTLEKSEEASNSFLSILQCLVAVSATGFPPEHWKERNIPAAFRKLGTVVEINQECLNGNYSSMRVVVKRLQVQHLPDDLRVANPGDVGTTIRIEMLRLRPFFPRPPGPGPHGGPRRVGWLRLLLMDRLLLGRLVEVACQLLLPNPALLPPAPHLAPCSAAARLALSAAAKLARILPPSPSAIPAQCYTSPPPPPRQRRGRTLLADPPKRASARLAAKEPALFVDATSREVQRKALRDGLMGCSKELQRQVTSRKSLKKKKPLGPLDLGRRRAVAVAAATEVSP